jgi:hypothetical protein
LTWFDAELAGTPYVPPPPINYFKPAHLGFDGKALHLDAAAFGVTDVARLCEQLLNYTDRTAHTQIEDGAAVVSKVLELVTPWTRGRNSVWARHSTRSAPSKTRFLLSKSSYSPK